MLLRVGRCVNISCWNFKAKYKICCLGQFNNCFNTTQWTYAKLILCYKPDNESLKRFVDADWGNNPDNRRSYTDYSFIFAGGPISWDWKKQRTVAFLSAEVEYMGLAEVVTKAIYLQTFLSELGFKNLENVTVLYDIRRHFALFCQSQHADLRHVS